CSAESYRFRGASESCQPAGRVQFTAPGFGVFQNLEIVEQFAKLAGLQHECVPRRLAVPLAVQRRECFVDDESAGIQPVAEMGEQRTVQIAKYGDQIEAAIEIRHARFEVYLLKS